MKKTTLTELLHDLGPTPKREAFVTACGTSLQYLRHLAAGVRQASVEMAVAIEKASRNAGFGIVPCESLRRDVDWVYLKQRRLT